MLCAKEFTVGTLAAAAAPSLMLPRTRYEATFLIGQIDNNPTAVFLGGDYNFHSIECSSATTWQGLLIPNVRIEVDETSLFDPHFRSPKLGTLLRADTSIAVSTTTERQFGRRFNVVMETDLQPVHDLAAGFSRWCIVIGKGQEKRVLWEIDTGQEPERLP